MNKHNYLAIIGIALCTLVCVSCGNKKKTVSLTPYADTAYYFAKKINSIENQWDGADIETYLEISSEISGVQDEANAVLASMFNAEKDTLFLPFEQTQNGEKLQIKSVWITEFKYDEIEIAARVEARDHSSFKGPHVGLAIIDKTKLRREIGGGLQGSTDDNLVAGETYIFTGTINNLHLLSDFKKIVFDDKIEKW